MGASPRQSFHKIMDANMLLENISQLHSFGARPHFRLCSCSVYVHILAG